MAAKRIEPVPEPTMMQNLGDRIWIWLAIILFSVALNSVVAELFRRTGAPMDGLAGFLGVTTALALGAVAEPAIRARHLLDQQNAELKRSWLTPPPGE
jgi:NhaP-type Na+/H+ or K+/H+ antiporter